MRFLFDKYIIKREELQGKEGWSIKTLKRYEKTQASYVNTFGKDSDYNNETIATIQSMFHVSTPTMIYKHWFNATLYFLNSNTDPNNEIDFDKFLTYLDKFAKNLLLHRFLASEPVDYFDLIYHPGKLNLKNYKIDYDHSKLKYGNIENNLVFNYLDYILWVIDYPNAIGNFEFTFRSSVEHFYPQNPIGGESLSDLDTLHSFGNLCLISHSKNSKLNNHLPSAKKDYFVKSASKLPIDSIKLNVMINAYDVNEWGIESIKKHNIEMIDILNEYLA